MIDKTKAIELRKQGKQYAEIVEILGCSLSWCKQNLKDVIVTKDMTNKQLYDSVKELMLEIEVRVKNG